MTRAIQRWWPLRLIRSGGSAAPRTPAQLRRQRAIRALLLGLAIGLGFWAAIALQISGESYTFKLDHPSPVSVQAPRDVVFESEVLTAEKRAQAESSEETLLWRRDITIPPQQRADLNQLLLTISNVRDDPSLTPQAKFEKLTTLPSASVVLSSSLASNILTLDSEAWTNLRRQTVDLYDRAIAHYRYELDHVAVTELRERWLPYWATELPPRQRELALFFSSSFLRVNSTLDLEATAKRKQEARDSVKPVQVRVQKGEIIVGQGEIVQPLILEKLQEVGAIQPRLNLAATLGRGLLALLLALIFSLYLLFFQRRIVERTRQMVVLGILLLVTALAARLLLPLWPEWPYAFPLAAAVLVLAVLFDGQIALVSAVVLSLVIGVMDNNVLALTVTMFVGSGVSVFMLRRAERSLTFLLAGVAVAATTALAQIAFWTQTSSTRWDELLPIMFFSGVNGLLSAILSLGLFNLVGRAAGIVTPLQLMELAHPNQPLLRKLIREAPGTYYHSVAVGNLAESAAEAVDADALLLRVAAYYHDIGKTIRPYFFTDNQTDRENVHDDLDPRISAEIIADHVREGKKMAVSAGLPQQIIDFISTHHGTSVIRNFYQIALQKEDSVNVEDYRYPGPKPSTREQGILMLADSVEATVRSKSQNGKLLHARANEQERKEARASGRMTLEDLVGSIIDERMRNGQLDETPLTLRDLTLIKQSFVTSLQGLYHPRADYAPQIINA